MERARDLDPTSSRESHLGTTAIADGFTLRTVLPVTTRTVGTGVVIRGHPPRTPARGICLICSPVAHIKIGPVQGTRTREAPETNQYLRHHMVSMDLLWIGLVEIEFLLTRRRSTHHRGNDQLTGNENAAQSSHADVVVTQEKTRIVEI